MRDRGTQILIALFGLFVFVYALAVRHYDRVRPWRPKKIHMLVYGDAVFYYSFTQTIVFRHTLDTTETARYYWHKESAAEDWKAETGLLNNYCSIGAPLMWVPFVLLVHLFVWGDGLSMIYPAAAAFGSALFAWFGLFLTYRKYRDLPIVVALWLGSNLAYYMSVEALVSHACSFFIVTVFALEALDPGESPPRWAGLGALLGAAALVRAELAILALILLPQRRFACWAAFVGTAALVFAPQFLVWKHVTGHWMARSAGWFEPWPRHALQALFSTRHGAFLWHPVYFLGTLGLLAPGPRRPRIVAACVIAGATLFYGWRAPWWGFHAFGMRYFVAFGFFFAIGLANGAAWLRGKSLRAWPVWAIASVLMIWNASLLLLYVTQAIPQADPVPLSRLLLAPFYAARVF